MTSSHARRTDTTVALKSPLAVDHQGPARPPLLWTLGAPRTSCRSRERGPDVLTSAGASHTATRAHSLLAGVKDRPVPRPSSAVGARSVGARLSGRTCDPARSTPER